MAWELNADRPIYLQLVDQIKLKIVSGAYKPGERLPSVRDLAADAAVNPNTMQKALAELEAQGLLFTMRTSGKTVTEDSQRLRELREQMAEEALSDLLATLERLGYSEDEIRSFLQLAYRRKNDCL